MAQYIDGLHARHAACNGRGLYDAPATSISLAHPRRHVPVHKRFVAAGCMPPAVADMTPTGHGRSALPPPLTGVGSQPGLPPRSVLPGIHSRQTPLQLLGRNQLPVSLTKIPPQHALHNRIDPGGPVLFGQGVQWRWILGPLTPVAFPQVRASHFGVIPKGSTSKWRLILDMSSPKGMSINDGSQEVLCSLSYVSVEDAAKGVMAKGRSVLLAKVNVKSAYRNVPKHPDDRWLTGMLWDGGYTLTQPSHLVCDRLQR